MGFTRLNQIDIGGLHHKLHPYRYSITPFFNFQSYRNSKLWYVNMDYYFYILSESAPWDQLCSSTIGQGRLHIVYELHTSLRRLLLASPESFLRQSLYSCCIRAVKELGFEAVRLPPHSHFSRRKASLEIQSFCWLFILLSCRKLNATGGVLWRDENQFCDHLFACNYR